MNESTTKKKGGGGISLEPNSRNRAIQIRSIYYTGLAELSISINL